MIKKGLLVCIMYASMAWGLNLHPFPKSFTHTIRVSPYYEAFKFKSLSIPGGSVEDMYSDIGVALHWGTPFTGYEVHYNFMNSTAISPLDSDIVQTELKLDSYKFRKYFPIIKDISNQMSLFMSYGTYSGFYLIQTLSEESGITAYKKRILSGQYIDLGAVFSYAFNPDWHIFISGRYQYSLSATIQTELGESTSAPKIEYTGAAIALGTALHL
jgi:hypothetical protein